MPPFDSHPPADPDASGDASPPSSDAARRPRRKRRRKSRSGGKDGSEPKKAAAGAPAPPASPEELARVKDLQRQSGELPKGQAGIIRRRLSGARRLLDEGRSAARPLAAIERDLTRMLEARAARLGRPLEVTYPAELPVSLAR
ncbi:MAG: hypothetical protein P8I44_13275 [Phycisphaerales bacterium]|nr:hypothetical protein [Phycisphaerales bacterium]